MSPFAVVQVMEGIISYEREFDNNDFSLDVWLYVVDVADLNGIDLYRLCVYWCVG